MKQSRIIFHIDMNCFYAAVEQAKNPSLKNKPLAIAGNPKERKGIIITCSYEARAKGVYTTMPVWKALQKCPELIIMPPNFEMYRKASKEMFQIIRQFTNEVEPVSIDEGYIDVSEIVAGKEAIQLAQTLQQTILQQLHLPCSIGIAPNKFLAKTASDMKKPLGITILRKRDVPQKLWQQPVIKMHGVGKSTAEKLATLHIETIGDLAKAEPYALKERLGKNGIAIYEHANGIDHRRVNPAAIYDTKSVGNSTTTPYNLTEWHQIVKVARTLAEKVANRLDAKNLASRTISIQMRTSEWQMITRSKTFTNMIYTSEQISREALLLFEKHWQGEALRLLGISMQHVQEKEAQIEQLSIFNFEKHVKEEPILQVLHEIQSKYGKESIQKGMKKKKRANYAAQTSFSKDFLIDHIEED